ncbi:hypothetical protein KKJ25_19875 [Xenorhabdus bovienii]|uniref:hypothetical protein n=1 Tax=Xenorhabdus bovienii TaxID=40576 RepID=UPI00237C6A9B|nr:hypothetical protein [Xenorhabdus bovienii]MDE1497125.1 hypothetical protein [Xenorhabdus bovienii]
MFAKITTMLATLFYKIPILSKLITFALTVLFIIQIADFAHSDFKDLFSGVVALFYFVSMSISFYFVIHKSEIIGLNIMEYFIANQNKVTTNEELKFFYHQSEASGFKKELEKYITSLDRKSSIKDCMIKCLELSKSNVDMKA